MKKIRTEKVNKAIAKSKIAGVKKAALERLKNRFKCDGTGCSTMLPSPGFCDTCANEPSEDHK